MICDVRSLKLRVFHSFWMLSTFTHTKPIGEGACAPFPKVNLITRLHPQGRWPEGPPSAAHVSLCLTFGTLKLHSSPLKPSKSRPQNLKYTYFWDLETPFFAPETFKIWSQNLKIVHFWVPFLDRILNVSRAKFGVSRSQKQLKMTQKCPNCFGI